MYVSVTKQKGKQKNAIYKSCIVLYKSDSCVCLTSVTLFCLSVETRRSDIIVFVNIANEDNISY